MIVFKRMENNNNDHHDNKFRFGHGKHHNDNSDGQDVSSTTSSSAPSTVTAGMRRLDPSFQEPGPMDVICARGKEALQHSGNRRFRSLIQANLDNYSKASSKLEKSLIVSSIVNAVRDSSPNGGFVRNENGIWYEVGDHIAREKCGQSFRDMLHTKYKSSTKAKMRRRKETQEQVGTEVSKLMKSNLSVAAKMKQLSSSAAAAKGSKIGSKTTTSLKSNMQMKSIFEQTNSELLKQIKKKSPAKTIIQQNASPDKKKDIPSDVDTSSRTLAMLKNDNKNSTVIAALRHNFSSDLDQEHTPSYQNDSLSLEMAAETSQQQAQLYGSNQPNTNNQFYQQSYNNNRPLSYTDSPALPQMAFSDNMINAVAPPPPITGLEEQISSASNNGVVSRSIFDVVHDSMEYKNQHHHNFHYSQQQQQPQPQHSDLFNQTFKETGSDEDPDSMDVFEL